MIDVIAVLIKHIKYIAKVGLYGYIKIIFYKSLSSIKINFIALFNILLKIKYGIIKEYLEKMLLFSNQNFYTIEKS